MTNTYGVGEKLGIGHGNFQHQVIVASGHGLKGPYLASPRARFQARLGVDGPPVKAVRLAGHKHFDLAAGRAQAVT